MSYNNSIVYLEERIARKNERIAQLEAENATWRQWLRLLSSLNDGNQQQRRYN